MTELFKLVAMFSMSFDHYFKTFGAYGEVEQALLHVNLSYVFLALVVYNYMHRTRSKLKFFF